MKDDIKALKKRIKELESKEKKKVSAKSVLVGIFGQRGNEDKIMKNLSKW